MACAPGSASGWLELVEQERDALEAVAAVAKPVWVSKPTIALLICTRSGRLRAVGRHRALGPLGRDRARAVGEQQPDQHLQANSSSGAGRSPVMARPASSVAVQERRISSLGTPQKRSRSWRAAGHRGADQRAVERRYQGRLTRRAPADALALQRTPGDRQRDRGQHRVGGDAVAEAAQELRNTDLAPRASSAASRAAALGSGAAPSSDGVGRDRASSKVSSRGVRDLVQEQVDQRIGRAPRALDPARAEDAGGRRQHAVGRVAGVARGIGRRQHRIAVEVDVGGDRDVDQRIVVGAVRARAARRGTGSTSNGCLARRRASRRRAGW